MGAGKLSGIFYICVLGLQLCFRVVCWRDVVRAAIPVQQSGSGNVQLITAPAGKGGLEAGARWEGSRKMEAWGLEKPQLQTPSPVNAYIQAGMIYSSGTSSAHIWKAWPAGQSRMAGCREKSSCCASSSCSSGTGSSLPAAPVCAICMHGTRQKAAGGRH